MKFNSLFAVRYQSYEEKQVKITTQSLLRPKLINYVIILPLSSETFHLFLFIVAVLKAHSHIQVV